MPRVTGGRELSAAGVTGGRELRRGWARVRSSLCMPRVLRGRVRSSLCMPRVTGGCELSAAGVAAGACTFFAMYAASHWWV